MFATCNTSGCENYLEPIPFEYPDGEVVTVICGSCAVPVTELSEIKPQPGKELPAWILQMLPTTS